MHRPRLILATLIATAALLGGCLLGPDGELTSGQTTFLTCALGETASYDQLWQGGIFTCSSPAGTQAQSVFVCVDYSNGGPGTIKTLPDGRQRVAAGCVP